MKKKILFNLKSRIFYESFDFLILENDISINNLNKLKILLILKRLDKNFYKERLQLGLRSTNFENFLKEAKKCK